ncbi:hypothetical protein ACIQWZ_37240 [Streptomyces sp. NPDC098077]|uniref:hypothetical protein n=1 Tax=Streptomyces sp. NPDC098077 TaxID=3366093 RepID=UPI00381D769A
MTSPLAYSLKQAGQVPPHAARSDPRTGGRFRAGRHIKGVRRTQGVYELTWSMGTGPAVRATFEYGTEVRPGTPHVIWRRIGTHQILTGP